MDVDKEKINEVVNKIEKDYYLLGCTAIEDQLQDDVAKTIDNFIKIGVKVWVLTGDNTDSAVSIAFSCQLITLEFILFDFKNMFSIEELGNSMNEYSSKIDLDRNRKYGLIISTDELKLITSNSELIEKVI